MPNRLLQLLLRKNGYLMLLAIGIMLLDQSGVLLPAQSRVQNMVQPLKSIAMIVVQRIQIPVSSVFSTFDKTERIKELEEKYARAMVTIAEMEGYQRENEQLRTLVDQAGGFDQSFIVTRPILSLAYPALQGGSAEGINAGAVVTIHKVMVGVVSQVFDHQAKIALLEQPTTQPVLVQINNSIQAVTQGDGKRLLVVHIPKDAILKEGDSVTTLGQQGIPAQLLIGTIAYIQNDPQSPTQTAVIERPVSFYDSLVVEVR